MPPDRRDHSEPLFEVKPPADPALESLVLGAIIRDGAPQYEIVSAIISVGDFHLEKNRRVYSRICDLAGRGDPIDRVTVVNELVKNEQLESIGGLVSLVSLDEGLPEVTAIANYCHRLRDLSQRRYLMGQAQALMTRATDEREQVTDIIASLTESIGLVQTGKSEEEGRNPTKIVEDFPGGIEAFLDPTQQPPGIPTGFRAWDQMLGGGFRDDELVVIAARPSQGKTGLALAIAEHVAVNKGKPVDIYSIEMSASSLLQRMVCSRARVDSNRLRNGYMTREERAKMQLALFEITEAPLTIFDKKISSMEAVETSILKRSKDSNAPALRIIDYLQLMGGKKKSENRNLEIGDMTRRLKLLCKLGPIILLSQLSRANEKRPGASRRPQMADCRDGGSIESDADIIAGIHREEMYVKDREDIRGMAEVIILKNRNGPVGTAILGFLAQFVRFENRAIDLEPWTESLAEEPPPQAEITYADSDGF